MSIKNWSFRRGLAIDVAVICPLAESHLGKPEPCESYAQNQKIARYVGAFENSDYDFAPVIFETSGAVNKEGETILKQVIRFASKREGVSHTVYASRAWARFSCCVQAASAQQILNRDFFDSEVAVNLLNLCLQATMNSSCVSFSLCLLFLTTISLLVFETSGAVTKKADSARTTC